MPKMLPRTINKFSWYFNAFGNNSWIAKVIIIPATNNKITLIMVSFIIFLKNKNAKNAPKGSANPDINVFLIASFLLPVA